SEKQWLVVSDQWQVEGRKNHSSNSPLATDHSPLFSKVSGDHTGGATPVPIPNTEVKPSRAYGTARVTAWESRSSPGLKFSRGGARARPLCFQPMVRSPGSPIGGAVGGVKICLGEF